MIDINKLEPGCADGLVGVDASELDPAHYIGVMLTSIAISQKRQADIMATMPQPVAFEDQLAAVQELVKR